ncbi:MAG: hypothetical protein EPO00_05115 [Chloroflexota bacterium]|nr:MAG: hypothetical protein EPO00_05115 [Chloroflexota bacterium]
MSLGPAPVLALLLALVHVSLYVLIRGSAGQRLPWLVLAAFLGAWAGDALGARLGIGYVLIGDFHLIVASVMAWVGIAGVAIVAILGPQPVPGGAEPVIRTTGLSSSRFRRVRARPDGVPGTEAQASLGDVPAEEPPPWPDRAADRHADLDTDLDSELEDPA